MAAINDPTIALGPDFKKLSGPENFTDWFQRFKDIANIYGYREHFKGRAEVVAKPVAPAFSALQQDDDDDVVQETPLVDWQYQLAVYQFQLQKWKDYDHASRSALALLHAAVEPQLWKELKRPKSPASAIKAIKRNYETNLPDDIASDRARAWISSLELEDPTAVRQFLNDFEERYGDVRFTNLTSEYCIMSISRALPKTTRYSYVCFCENQWRYYSFGRTTDRELFKEFRSLLLKYTADNFFLGVM